MATRTSLEHSRAMTRQPAEHAAELGIDPERIAVVSPGASVELHQWLSVAC